MPKTAKEIMRQPYTRILIPAEEGGFSAEVLEFPGCIAEGDSAEEAIANLEAAAESWIEAALEMGQPIPPPSAAFEYSGRIVLRLPKSLHKAAARLAERDHTSLNQFFVSAIAARVGSEDLYERLLDRIEERLTPTARNILLISESAIQVWKQLAPGGSFNLPAWPQETSSNTAREFLVEVSNA